MVLMVDSLRGPELFGRMLNKYTYAHTHITTIQWVKSHFYSKIRNVFATKLKTFMSSKMNSILLFYYLENYSSYKDILCKFNCMLNITYNTRWSKCLLANK